MTVSRLLPGAFAVALLFGPGVTYGEVQVAGVFSDHMVLQRSKPLVVWGWAGSGEKVTVTFAPRQGSGQADQGAVRVTFGHVGPGLAAGLWTPAKGLTQGGTFKGFEVAGAEGKWHGAKATIDGDAVVIRSPAVPKPTAARYAWVRDPEGSLYNKDGFPALPFRTDR